MRGRRTCVAILATAWLTLSMPTAATVQDTALDAAPVHMALPATSPVTRYINFEQPQACFPSTTLYALQIDLLPVDDRGGAAQPYMPRLPPDLRAHVGQPTLAIDESELATATLPINANWHGLRLQAMTVWRQPHSDNGGFSLRFADTLRRVRQRLNALGFDIPREGAREIGEELPVYMQLRTEDGVTILSCGT